MTASKQNEVLNFWFKEVEPSQRFMSDPDFDAEIARRFMPLVNQSSAGKLDHWADTTRGCLALIIALDQFSRNLFRGSSRAFAMDEKARGFVRRGIHRDYPQDYSEGECSFFYLPFMHSENMEDQNTSVELYTELGSPDYAIKHREIIQKFGRFPNRNAALGRNNTPEEQVFLDMGGGF